MDSDETIDAQSLLSVIATTPLKDQEAFATLWATLDFSAETEHDGSRTIRPRAHSSAPSPQARLSSVGAGLTVGDCIGRGGMGEVFSATEEALGREVAIKVPYEDQGRAGARQLLREAWAMGSLSHPNVVPVHRLGANADGAPTIVMKRISGTSLDRKLADEPSDCEETARPKLELLMEVARAVEFSHSRGILHRDIKPENVMIGEYGEVYLVDWGLAVGLDEAHKGRLRMASDIAHPEGTPNYMAPEMVSPTVVPIDERTDIYLLGATLHEILVGHPPHAGQTLIEVIKSIVLADQERNYPSWVPPELVAITERAMAYAPESRFQSARDFRLAIAEALTHAASRQLADEAAERLSRLCTLATDEDVDPNARASRGKELFTEGLFACEQSLSTWSDNPLALSTQRALVLRMCAFELDLDRIESAGDVLSRIDEPPAALRARLDEALARRAIAAEELAVRRHDDDLSIAASTRVRVTWALAVLTSAFALVVAVVGPEHPMLRSGLVAVLGSGALIVGVAVTAIIGWRGRSSVLRNQANRQILLGAVIVLGAVVLTRIYGASRGEPYGVLATRTMLLWSMAAGILAATVDSRILGAAAPALGAWIASVVWPHHAMYIVALGYFVSFAALASIWSRDQAP